VLKIRSGGSMAHWIFNMKFPYDTQFLFASLMFDAGEDGNLELFTWGPTPSHLAPVYRKDPYFSVDPSTSSISGSVCSGLNPYAGSYYLSDMTSQERLIWTHIFQPSPGTSSSSSSGVSPDRDSAGHYLEIGGSIG
jgi:hypothetical protein